ncbi:YktB family protein [Brevibacillus sp. GCM10020057]|uniref:YktB family protein n=1 Tax=Brevibacillus sp. GCM10020057 TaxID=3317327 RepID=UPI00362E8D2B
MSTSFTGFLQEDFDVFAIEGLDQRMEAIKGRIRPKLEALGQHFAPGLSVASGSEMFFHVAKHARRTVNPPADTWVAWTADKRGYKKHPHFQIGLWGTHLFVWYAVIYEAPAKEQISRALLQNLNDILAFVPDDFRWSPDHTQPDSTPQKELGKDGVEKLILRLGQVKKAELLCGITIDRHDPVLADKDALLSRLDETFSVLTRLYQISHCGA